MYFSKAVTSTHPGGGGYPQKDPGIRPLRAKVCGIRPYGWGPVFWPARHRAQNRSISAAAARRTQLCVQGGSIQVQPHIKIDPRDV